jgi:dihydroorotate dehydrogenase electron transfer subunit
MAPCGEPSTQQSRMTDPHGVAPYSADQAVYRVVELLEQERLARDTYRVRFVCPEIARRIVPGQFVMLKLLGGDDPLLGRPFALYDVVRDSSGEPKAIDLVYLVVGKFTTRLAALPTGARLAIWGPLGNGFPPLPVERLIMVAGGIGQTPFLALGKEYLGGAVYGTPFRSVPPAKSVLLLYGAREAGYLAGLAEFQAAGIEVRTSTDDGSSGLHGLVTELLARELSGLNGEEKWRRRIVCCGPEKMMAAVAELAFQAGAPCEVSLETPMACGIGICFSCVAKVRQEDGSWDYRRTCVEGPVFAAEQIVW